MVVFGQNLGTVKLFPDSTFFRVDTGDIAGCNQIFHFSHTKAVISEAKIAPQDPSDSNKQFTKQDCLKSTLLHFDTNKHLFTTIAENKRTSSSRAQSYSKTPICTELNRNVYFDDQ